MKERPHAFNAALLAVLVACAGAPLAVMPMPAAVEITDAAGVGVGVDVEDAPDDAVVEDAARESSICVEDCPAQMDGGGGASCACSGKVCAYASGSCTCFYGNWRCFDVVNACPDTFARAVELQGSACNVPACSYASGSCACTRGGQSCGGNVMSCDESSDPRDCPRLWVCDAKRPAGCPNAVPRSGSACNHPGLVCGYDCESATCTRQGSWFVPRRLLLP
jgi:hypothetical protein